MAFFLPKLKTDISINLGVARQFFYHKKGSDFLFLKHFINTQYAGVKNRFSEVSSNTNRQRKSFYNEV